MAAITVKVLAKGTAVRIRRERGRYVVIKSEWSKGREVDHLLRVDNGKGAYRSVTRDRLIVSRKQPSTSAQPLRYATADRPSVNTPKGTQ